MSLRVTVLGTGLMGAGMARSLLRAGHRVTVWNRTPERAAPLAEDGALLAGTPAEAVADADVVLVVVFDAASVLQVLDAAGAHAPAGAVWMQCATIGTDGVRAVDARARELGLQLVETQMMGSKAQAEEGRLILIGGGPSELFAQVATVVDAVAQKIVHAGERVGDGTAVKLACNAWVAATTAGTAQSLALVRAQGLDPRLWLDVITGGTTDSPYCHLKGEKILAGDFSPQFAVDALRKDLALISQSARSNGVSTALLDTLTGLYRQAADEGHGDRDIAAVSCAF